MEESSITKETMLIYEQSKITKAFYYKWIVRILNYIYMEEPAPAGY